MARILYLDIETAPNLAYTWSLFKPVIHMDWIVEPARILGFSWMWGGDEEAQWDSEFHNELGRRGMLRNLQALLDEADIVITYNGNRFDIPWVEGEFIAEGIDPPSPYHRIDLYLEIRKHSRYPIRKLDYVALRLLDDRKVKSTGAEMWLGCMRNERKHWDDMRTYALKDTELLPPLYEIIRPWISNHPNIAILDEKAELCCPKCGSDNFIRKGSRTTAAGRYPRYLCKNCKGWFRGHSRESTTPGRNA